MSLIYNSIFICIARWNLLQWEFTLSPILAASVPTNLWRKCSKPSSTMYQELTSPSSIFGCGPVGLLCMAVAKAFGASRIIAVDIVPARLEFAKKYAATHTYLPPAFNPGESKPDYSRRNAELMKQQLGVEDRGKKAIDLVIDASGAEVSIQTAFHIVKAGGTFVQVGSLPLIRAAELT